MLHYWLIAIEKWIIFWCRDENDVFLWLKSRKKIKFDLITTNSYFLAMIRELLFDCSVEPFMKIFFMRIQNLIEQFFTDFFTF